MYFHKAKFLNERVRKEARVFAILSKYLKTRNVNQSGHTLLQGKLEPFSRKLPKIIATAQEDCFSFENRTNYGE